MKNFSHHVPEKALTTVLLTECRYPSLKITSSLFVLVIKARSMLASPDMKRRSINFTTLSIKKRYQNSICFSDALASTLLVLFQRVYLVRSIRPTLYT